MKTQKLGSVIAVVGALYLVTVAWMSSWWYVPALLEHEARAFTDRTPQWGTAFSILWASSGVIGAIVVAVGAAVYSALGRFRLLLLAAGGTLLVVWLGFWSTFSHNATVFGVGGGLILLCFLTFCLDWAKTRRDLGGFNFPFAKKAMERLSGDQKGHEPFSVPGRGCAETESSRWTQS